MSLSDLFMSDEYMCYRKAMVQNIIDFISERLFSSDSEDLVEIRGALKLARRLINLPTKMSSSMAVQLKTAEDLHRLQAQFIVQHLIGREGVNE